jgi:hypothetical protein
VIIPHSVIDMLYQSTIAILLLVGFESVTALGSEAVNPHRDIKRGVLISLLIQGGVCYLFEYFSANLAIGGAALTTGSGASLAHGYTAASTDVAPIGDMIKTVGNHYLGNSGQALAVLVAFTVLLALVGTALASLNCRAHHVLHVEGQGDAGRARFAPRPLRQPLRRRRRPGPGIGGAGGVRVQPRTQAFAAAVPVGPSCPCSFGPN